MGTTTVVALAVALLGTPAYAAVNVELSISPERVTVSPDSGATQVVRISGDRDADIAISFDVAPPGFSGAAATRRGDPCKRVGGAEWLCKGFGDVTITYPAVPETVAERSHKLTATAGGRRAYGWVDVDMPDPEPEPEPTQTTDPPADEPDNHQMPKPAGESDSAAAVTATAEPTTRMPTTKPAPTTDPRPTRAAGFGSVIGAVAHDLVLLVTG